MQKRLPCPTLLKRRTARGASSGAGQPWAWLPRDPCQAPAGCLRPCWSTGIFLFPEHLCVHVCLGDTCRVPRVRNWGLCLVLSDVRSVPLRSLPCGLGSALVLLYPGLLPPACPRLPTCPSPGRLCRREIPCRLDC